MEKIFLKKVEIDKNFFIFEIFLGKKRIGFLNFEIKKNCANWKNINILKDFRRIGIGTFLFAEFVKFLVEKKIENFQSGTKVTNSVEAKNFHQKMGQKIKNFLIKEKVSNFAKKIICEN